MFEFERWIWFAVFFTELLFPLLLRKWPISSFTKCELARLAGVHPTSMSSCLHFLNFQSLLFSKKWSFYYLALAKTWVSGKTSFYRPLSSHGFLLILGKVVPIFGIFLFSFSPKSWEFQLELHPLRTLPNRDLHKLKFKFSNPCLNISKPEVEKNIFSG